MDLGWETLEKSRRYRLKKSMMTKIMNGKAPGGLQAKTVENVYVTQISLKLEIHYQQQIAINSQSVTVELFSGIKCPQTNAKRVMSSDSWCSLCKLLVNSKQTC